MTKVYVCGALRSSSDGEPFVLTAMEVFSEDPWHMTQYHDKGLIMVQMSPAIEGATFTEAEKNAWEFVSKQYPSFAKK